MNLRRVEPAPDKIKKMEQNARSRRVNKAAATPFHTAAAAYCWSFSGGFAPTKQLLGASGVRKGAPNYVVLN